MTATATDGGGGIAEVADRLSRIEAVLDRLVRERTAKEWYTTAEVAAALGRAEYTVREWCRLGRVRATKGTAARGPHPEWRIAHDELQRLRNDGLRPPPRC